jgi:predicted O-methyltransferase YrrM
MIYKDLIKQLNKFDKINLHFASSFTDLEKALDIVLKGDKPPIQDMIEIGTFNGLSTAIFTYYAQRIFTFDICQRNAEYVWNSLNIRDRINSFVSTQENIDIEINYFIKELMYIHDKATNFNFAFVDGDHTREGIEHDFNLVKFTKRVLFHDYDTVPEVYGFCNEIGAKQVGNLPYAYWEEK